MKLATIEGQCVVGGDFNLVLNPLLDQSSSKISSLSKAATALKQGMKDISITDVAKSLSKKEGCGQRETPMHNIYSHNISPELDITFMNLGTKQVDLAWQIKKETFDKFIHSILTERLLDNSPSINAEFKQFYEDLYKTGRTLIILEQKDLWMK